MILGKIFKVLTTVSSLLLPVCVFCQTIDFKEIDKAFAVDSDSEVYLSKLQTLLPGASVNADKAQIYWRMAKAYLIKGEYATGKTDKRSIFAKGIEYADKAISLDPSNPDCHMWHSACIGRECLTHNLMDQAAAVPVMTEDLTYILDKLGKTDYSGAWHAMAEIYLNHPFKSNDTAINYTRKALECIPDGELRICLYTLMAEMLWKRDWSAAKRSSQFASDRSNFKKTYSSNIEKFSFFTGTSRPVWSGRDLDKISDREEAKAIISYAEKIYNSASFKGKTDIEDYKALEIFKKKLN